MSSPVIPFSSIIPLPSVVWRSPHDEMLMLTCSAADYLRHTFKRGVVAPEAIDYLQTLPAATLLWVVLGRVDTPRLGPADQLIRLRLDIPAVALASDGAGAYLIFASNDIEELGAVAATQSQHNPAQPLDPLAPLQGDLEASLVQAQTPAPHDYEEEEKRVARGGGDDDNPANAMHAFNIRPDVQDTPSGTVTVTTIKNKEYEAFPDAEPELSASELLAMKLEGRVGTEQRPEPGQARDTEPTPTIEQAPVSDYEDVVLREAAQDAQRQEAEIRAQSSEVHETDAGLSAREQLAAQLEGRGESVPQPELTQTHDMAHVPAPTDQADAVPEQEAVTTQQETTVQQEAAENAQRQEAEMKARNGEAYEADSGLSASEHLSSKLQGTEQDAAEQANVFEIAQEAGEERGGGGRSMI